MSWNAGWTKDVKFLYEILNSLQILKIEHLADIQTLVLSDDENEYNDEPVINFEQNLYKQALNLAEHENDPWKELDAENMTILQKTSYKEAGSEYSEEISKIKAKPITLCIIIDNKLGKIRCCNETSNKRLRELIGA
ncbi:13432_t:CDS:2 [Dentiscutata heterogama]|uniref:13432_t:CDS:1 n=1 Tax=Dentiscutata heterogama TaxID=1316150 RepID=A0ACA9KM03_9GLOM|nr:13432_t:CDS:2 [Dentiscutata heterogama]